MLKIFEIKKRWKYITEHTSTKKFILFGMIAIVLSIYLSQFAFVMLPDSLIKNISVPIFGLLYLYAIFFNVIYNFLGGQ